MRVIFISIFLFITGCTTSLWSPKYKQEMVDGFYVKSDTGELFVTGSSSAYLFDISKDFGEALTLTRKEDFYPTFNDFELKKDNTIQGTVSLTLLNDKPSPELEEQLISLGFKKDKLIERFILTEQINGQRYVVEGELPLEKLEKSVRIAVAQPSTFTETAGKIIATPATIAIDSAVVVPTVFFGATVMAAGGG
jgi:hypothetical protein